MSHANKEICLKMNVIRSDLLSSSGIVNPWMDLQVTVDGVCDGEVAAFNFSVDFW